MITIEEIKKIVSLQLGRRTVSSTDRLLEDLAAESADLVNILAKIEEKYDTYLPEEKIADIRTIQDIFEIAHSTLS